MTFKEAFARLNAWRTFVGAAVTGLMAAVVWLSAQVTTLKAAMEDMSRPSDEVRAEREKYFLDFKQSFRDDADPRKSTFLNDTVYRVRMQTMPPNVGADLLCWLAAEADAAQPDVGAVDGRTTETIISFLNANDDIFSMRRRGSIQWPFVSRMSNVDARTYCDPYLFAQRGGPLAGLQTTGAPEAPRSGSDPTVTRPRRLFVQVGDQAQTNEFGALGSNLAAQFPGLSYQGVEHVAGYSGYNEIRYYKSADRGAAQVLSNRLQCDGDRPRYVHIERYENDPLVREGTLELWIRAGVMSCEVAAPPAAS